MKPLITLALLFVCSTAFCQATTQSEFNYIKKGLKDVDEKGMDAKAGYTLGETQQSEFGNVKVFIRAVIRDKDNTLAGISIITYTTGVLSDTKKYFCLPAPSLKDKESYGLGEWQTDVDLMSSSEMKAVLKTVSYYYTVESSYHLQTQK